MEERIKCPSCGEMISKNNSECEHCGSPLIINNEQGFSNKINKSIIIIIAISLFVVIAIIGGVVLLSGNKDGNSGKHVFGDKSKHYNDKIEEKAKYILSLEPFDTNNNYIYVDSVDMKEPKLFYVNGKEIKLKKDDLVILYESFAAITRDSKLIIYDRYGELVSDGDFVGYDEYNKILKTSKGSFYNSKGIIGGEDTYSSISDDNYSLINQVTDSKYSIINTSGKLVYVGNRKANSKIDFSISSGSEDVVKYFAVTETNNQQNGKIININTGKVIYETVNGIEAVNGNLFVEKNYDKEVLYIFVQKDESIFVSMDAPISSQYMVYHNKNFITYEQSTGDMLPEDLFYSLSKDAYEAYKKDGYKTTYSVKKKDKVTEEKEETEPVPETTEEEVSTEEDEDILKFGIKKGDKELLECNNDAVIFYSQNIYKELKKQNKYYVKIVNEGKVTLYDLNNKKKVYDNFYDYRNGILTFISKDDYYFNDKDTKTLVNIITGKEKKVTGTIEIGDYYIKETTDKGITIYNTNLESIYTQKEEKQK